MEFQKFVKLLICKIQLYIGNKYEISEHKVMKNNSVELTGIMAKKKGSNAFPTFYVDDFYDRNIKEEDLEMLALKLAKGLENATIDEKVCLESFIDFETAKDKIILKLINAEKNQNLLLNIPYIRFHNLAIVFSYVVDNDSMGTTGSILIRNEHMENWSVDVDEMYKIAYENTKEKLPVKVYGICELLKQLKGEFVVDNQAIDDDVIPMRVITNSAKIYGAVAMLFTDSLYEVSEEMGGNFYILPSSVNEIIAVPDDKDTDPMEYLAMVTEVNETQVYPPEVLADSIYYFNTETKTVEWIC